MKHSFVCGDHEKLLHLGSDKHTAWHPAADVSIDGGANGGPATMAATLAVLAAVAARVAAAVLEVAPAAAADIAAYAAADGLAVTPAAFMPAAAAAPVRKHVSEKVSKPNIAVTLLTDPLLCGKLKLVGAAVPTNLRRNPPLVAATDPVSPRSRSSITSCRRHTPPSGSCDAPVMTGVTDGS
jgi:hypothetical protein